MVFENLTMRQRYPFHRWRGPGRNWIAVDQLCMLTHDQRIELCFPWPGVFEHRLGDPIGNDTPPRTYQTLVMVGHLTHDQLDELVVMLRTKRWCDYEKPNTNWQPLDDRSKAFYRALLESWRAERCLTISAQDSA